MSATTAPDAVPGLAQGEVALNFIGGEWREAAGGHRTEDIDPATGLPLALITTSGPADAEAAVAAAAAAYPLWAATSIFARMRIVQDAAVLLRERAASLALTMTLEGGKPLAETRGEVLRTSETLEALAGLMHRPSGEVHEGHRPGEQWTMTSRSPLGVVVVLPPWNFPLLIPAWKVVAALVTGNTVVLKPAEPAPLTCRAFASLLHDAGLPPGVLNLVLGRGSVLGPTLLRPPAAAVTLTGGNESGMVVARAAIEHGLKYQLELGGNNPALVLGDADLDLVERELVSGVLGSTGQKCTATRRVFVVEERFDEVLERLTRSFAAKRLGAGVDEGTDVGPLVNRAAQESFERTVAETVECGVDVRRFGVLPEAGCFVQPTILVDPDPSAGYVQRETFGPLVSVMRVRDAEEGVRRCNESIYGLSASVFTSDIGSAIRFAKAIEAGMVHVNSQTTGAEPHMPFGGMKASSNFSRELGENSLDWFSQTRAIYVEG